MECIASFVMINVWGDLNNKKEKKKKKIVLCKVSKTIFTDTHNSFVLGGIFLEI